MSSITPGHLARYLVPSSQEPYSLVPEGPNYVLASNGAFSDEEHSGSLWSRLCLYPDELTWSTPTMWTQLTPAVPVEPGKAPSRE